MSNSVFLKPDENGNWGSINPATTLSALQSGATATGNGTQLDVSNYSTIVLNVAFGGTATVVTEGSVDGTSWDLINGYSLVSGFVNIQVSSLTTNSRIRFYVAGLKYFRARISSWTSGTVDVLAECTSATGVFAPNTVSAGTDSASSSGYNPINASYGYIFDGTNWVRSRTASILTDSTSGGTLGASALWGFNGTNFDRVRTTNGQVRTSIYGTTGNVADVYLTSVDNVSSAYGLVSYSYPYLFNGSTFDRARIEKTFKWNEYLSLPTNTTFTVWTPTSTKTIRIMGMSVSVSGACALNVRVGTAGSGSRIAVLRFAGAGNYSIDFGNGYKATNATTDVLEINNPATNPTSATVDVHVSAWGTEE